MFSFLHVDLGIELSRFIGPVHACMYAFIDGDGAQCLPGKLSESPTRPSPSSVRHLQERLWLEVFSPY